MSSPTIFVHSPAPSPDGPIACTLPLAEYAGRVNDFSGIVFDHLVELQRPAPEHLRLVLDGTADPARVRELLVREQQCCPFFSFTLTSDGDRLLADLEVPAVGAAALDGFVAIAKLAAGR